MTSKINKPIETRLHCALCGFGVKVEYFENVKAHLCDACADLPPPSVMFALNEKRIAKGRKP